MMKPAASWTHKRDSEAHREHDFNNWLQELVFAVQAGDSKMVAFVAEELRKEFRKANRKLYRFAQPATMDKR